jgi:VanZ family protein
MRKRQARPPHRSSAIGLVLVLAALIGYASLYPFIGWRWPADLGWLQLLNLPLPPWRDRFDLVVNLAGYAPFGALILVAGVRSGGTPWRWWLAAVAIGSGLSFAMEVTQQFLPGRFPSILDWELNSAGTLLGASLGVVLHRLALIERWQAARDRWFLRRSGGALALLLLWPLGLLFPAPFPLGLGLSWGRVQEVLVDWLLDVPWAQDLLEWVVDVPAPEGREPQILEVLGMALGLLGPCLLGFSVTRPGWRRAVLAGCVALAGGVATTLSTALNFGPSHALAWVTPSVPLTWLVALGLAWAMVQAPQRLAAAAGLMVLSILMVLVAQSPEDPYFSLSLQAWEQGRFIRFHGLAQWLGWCWPLAATAWLLGRLAAAGTMEPLPTIRA